jgi:hypothetical protein
MAFVGIRLEDFEAFEMTVLAYDMGAIVRHRSAPFKDGSKQISAPIVVLGRAVIAHRSMFSGGRRRCSEEEFRKKTTKSLGGGRREKK